MGRPALPETNDVIPWRHRADAKLGNLYCREQQTASDAYREGWERIFGGRTKEMQPDGNVQEVR